MAKPHNKKQPAIHDESPAIDGAGGEIGTIREAALTKGFRSH